MARPSLACGLILEAFSEPAWWTEALLSGTITSKNIGKDLKTLKPH
jgi:hypothetical protein